MWIIRKDYVDSEYFKYILLDAEQKYMQGIGNVENNYFYEVLFHYLNLNNLVLDGNMFDFKMTPSWKNDKIIKVSNDLYTFYKSHNETGETVKLANEIFKDICIRYLKHQSKFFNTKNCNMYYVNSNIHIIHEIFILINIKGTSEYDIWKLKMDRRCIKGFSFNKIESITIDNLKKNALNDRLLELNSPNLDKMDPDYNLLFCIVGDKESNLDKISHSIKNTILLNRLMANDIRFDPNLISNALDIIFHEKILPFKLDQAFL